MEELSLLPHLFIFFNVSQISSLFRALRFTIILIYFDAHIVPDLANGDPFKVAYVSFDTSSSILEHFLIL